MSFVARGRHLRPIEEMVTAVSREVCRASVSPPPFPRLTYDEAMEPFGSDKPDLRFGLELCDLTDAVRTVDFRVFADPIAAGGRVRGLVAPGCAAYSRKQIDELTDLARRHGAGGLVHLAVTEGGELHGPAAKFLDADRQAALRERSGANPVDLLLVVADADPMRSADVLGRLRLELGDRLELRDENVLAYVWVYPFPMFTWDEENQRWDATHNPFSAPLWEEEERMDVDPGAVHAQQYDLALNGWSSAAEACGSIGETCWSGPSASWGIPSRGCATSSARCSMRSSTGPRRTAASPSVSTAGAPSWRARRTSAR